MKKSLLFIFLCVLLQNSFSQCITLILQPDSVAGKDALLESLPTYINTNQGSHSEFNAAAWTVGGVPELQRDLIDFDWNAIPPGAVVQSATLTLYNNPNSSNGLGNGQHSQLSGSNASYLQRVITLWNEYTVTWNNQPSTTTLNQATLPANTTPNEDYYIDVTQLVIDTKNNPGTSFGFMLRLITEQYYRILVFASSDNPDSTKHPKLEVCYTLNGSPPKSNFISSDSTFCNEGGQCIDFTDQSTNNPKSWQWHFPGAVPDTSTQQNPTNICYSTPGTYAVTLIVSNSNGSDSLTVSPMITFATSAAAPVLAFSGDTIYCSHAAAYQWYFNGSPIANATDSFYVATGDGVYAVQITDGNGCTRLSDGFTVAVGEVSGLDGVRIYPNPAEDELTIDIGGLLRSAHNDNFELSIYNVFGENVLQSEISPARAGQKSEINISSLRKGIYFIELTNGEKTFRTKMVKE